jgi:RNA polymerase sigma factor for flagellar operon FliA
MADRERFTLADTLPAEEPTPEAALAERERTAALARAIDALPSQQRTVLALYYDTDLTMHEIGAVLDVTESRISQIHTAAILRLRARLAAHTEELVA